MIDTHSHLFEDEFINDIDECIRRAKENGVTKIILVGFSHETNERAYEYSKKYPIFYPTAGLHPSEATIDYKNDYDNLVLFINTHKIYAIGECGLDYHYGKDNIKEQKSLFILQCELAIKLNLPIIVHSRDADLDTFNIIKSYNGKLKGVMHCYSGSLEMAKEYIKLGFYISLGGPVTFKNARVPKEVAKNIPIDRLLIETDCPFLAPTPFRGTRNESGYVKYVCEEIASLRGIPTIEVDKATTKNAINLFNLR